MRRILSAQNFAVRKIISAKKSPLRQNPLRKLNQQPVMTDKLPKFKLKIKNFERALLPQLIIDKVQKIQFNKKMKESPYVKRFE